MCVGEEGVCRPVIGVYGNPKNLSGSLNPETKPHRFVFMCDARAVQGSMRGRGGVGVSHGEQGMSV